MMPAASLDCFSQLLVLATGISCFIACLMRRINFLSYKDVTKTVSLLLKSVIDQPDRSQTLTARTRFFILVVCCAYAQETSEQCGLDQGPPVGSAP